MVQQNKIPALDDEKELEIKRKLRSLSIKEEEDVMNDRLNPRLAFHLRTTTMLHTINYLQAGAD
jgi:hypothetical protein